MKFGTWLGLAALLCAAGCSSSGKKTANQGDSKAVAEALSTGIMIEHGKKLSGVIPKPTADDVGVSQDDPPLTLGPGDDALMSLDVDNPDEADDPVEAMLVQFEDSNDHFEVPVEGGDGGVADGGTGSQHYVVKFSIDDGICKSFCKGEFTVVMIQALKLHKGGVSKHLKRDFKLDCRREGAEVCEDDKKTEKDAGSSGGGGESGSTGGGSGSTSATDDTIKAIDTLGTALKSFSNAGCKCAMSTASPYCEDDGAGLDRDAVECVTMGLKDNADETNVKAWAACTAGTLNAARTTCMACGEGACDASVAAMASAKCAALPADLQTAVDGCMLDVGPSAAP